MFLHASCANCGKGAALAKPGEGKLGGRRAAELLLRGVGMSAVQAEAELFPRGNRPVCSCGGEQK